MIKRLIALLSLFFIIPSNLYGYAISSYTITAHIAKPKHITFIGDMHDASFQHDTWQATMFRLALQKGWKQDASLAVFYENDHLPQIKEGECVPETLIIKINSLCDALGCAGKQHFIVQCTDPRKRGINFFSMLISYLHPQDTCMQQIQQDIQNRKRGGCRYLMQYINEMLCDYAGTYTVKETIKQIQTIVKSVRQRLDRLSITHNEYVMDMLSNLEIRAQEFLTTLETTYNNNSLTTVAKRALRSLRQMHKTYALLKSHYNFLVMELFDAVTLCNILETMQTHDTILVYAGDDHIKNLVSALLNLDSTTFQLTHSQPATEYTINNEMHYTALTVDQLETALKTIS